MRDQPPLLPAGAVVMPTRTIGLSVLTSLVIQSLNAVTGILLARELGPGGRGELAVILLWPSLLAAVGGLGVAEAATFHAARSAAPTGRLVGSAGALALVQSALLGGLGALVLPLALSRQDPAILALAYLYLAFIPLNLLTLHLMGVLNGLHHFRSYHFLRLLYIGAVAAGLVSLAALGSLTAGAVVGVYLVANATTMLCTVALLASKRPGRPGIDVGLARSLLGYGLKSHTSSVSSMLNERLDQLVISLFLAPAKLGLYVIAVTLTSLTSLVGWSVATVALPTIARLRSANERREAAVRFVRLTLVGATAVTLPLLAATPILIEFLFGEAFRPAAEVARLLLLAAVVLTLARVLGAILKAIDRPLDAGTAELAALTVTCASLALLLPVLGIFGAGLASLLAYSTSVAWSTRRAARALGVSPGALLLPRIGRRRPSLPAPRGSRPSFVGGEK